MAKGKTYWEPETVVFPDRERADKYKAILEGMEFQNLELVLKESEETCRKIGEATKHKFLSIVATQFQGIEEALECLSEDRTADAETILTAVLRTEYKGPGDNGEG